MVSRTPVPLLHRLATSRTSVCDTLPRNRELKPHGLSYIKPGDIVAVLGAADLVKTKWINWVLDRRGKDHTVIHIQGYVPTATQVVALRKFHEENITCLVELERPPPILQSRSSRVFDWFAMPSAVTSQQLDSARAAFAPSVPMDEFGLASNYPFLYPVEPPNPPTPSPEPIELTEPLEFP